MLPLARGTLVPILASGAFALAAISLVVALRSDTPAQAAYYASPEAARGGFIGGGGAPVPGILTNGDGTVKVRPDVAILSIGATAQAPTAAAAQTGVAERIARILQRAKDLKVADRDLKSSGYTITPQHANRGGIGGDPVITGYQAQQLLTVTLRDVDGAGKALDALVQNEGATNLSLRFAIEDPKQSQGEARKTAIEDARAKAQAMAQAAGVRLGKVLSITETGTSVPSPLQSVAGPLRADTQVPVGDLDVVVRVQVQFSIL